LGFLNEEDDDEVGMLLSLNVSLIEVEGFIFDFDYTIVYDAMLWRRLLVVDGGEIVFVF